MKALTDKIIDELEIEFDKKVSGSDEYLAGLDFALDLIKKTEKEADFEEISRVMMKHLGKRVDLYCPHHAVLITNTTAELMQGQRATGRVADYISD